MTQKKPVVEVCVETLEEGIEACRLGAQQLEVCSRLDVDGLTPNKEFVTQLSAVVKVPLKIMIRSRQGGFYYTSEEIEAMMADIVHFKAMRIDGIVTGALVKSETGEVRVDVNAMIRMCKAAFPFPVTMHKAIDECTDLVREVQVLREISNLRYILTSGGKPTALEGATALVEMQKAAGPSIHVIAAGRITPENLPVIKELTGLQYFHGRRIVG